MPAVCPTSQTDHLWSSALRWHLPCAAGTVAIKASQRRQVNQGILPMTCPRTVSTSSEELGTMGSLHRSDWYTKFQAICGKVRHIHSVSLVGGPPGSRSRHLGIKRGIRTVGSVRWCRNHPRFKGILSGGVGMVREKLRGILSVQIRSACGFTPGLRH